MNWKSESQLSEDDFVKTHQAHMGDSTQVENYLRIRHRKMNGRATRDEEIDAYRLTPFYAKYWLNDKTAAV